MKIQLVIGNDTEDGDVAARIACRLPFADASHVVLDAPCPSCGAGHCTLRGRDQHHSHNTYLAIAVAQCCDKPVGRLEVTVETLFGIEEDRRVLNGPWRVY